MATVAVFVALGGASYAALSLPANSVGSAQIKRGAVTLTKIDRRAQSALRGRTGARGPTGPKGDVGRTGDTGVKGDPGSALAYAHINQDGTSDPARSKNLLTSEALVAVSGVYCLSFTVTPATVSATLNGPGTGGQITTVYNPGLPGCNDTGKLFQIAVTTFDSGGSPANRSFDITVN